MAMRRCGSTQVDGRTLLVVLTGRDPVGIEDECELAYA